MDHNNKNQLEFCPENNPDKSLKLYFLFVIQDEWIDNTLKAIWTLYILLKREDS